MMKFLKSCAGVVREVGRKIGAAALVVGVALSGVVANAADLVTTNSADGTISVSTTELTSQLSSRIGDGVKVGLTLGVVLLGVFILWRIAKKFTRST